MLGRYESDAGLRLGVNQLRRASAENEQRVRVLAGRGVPGIVFTQQGAPVQVRTCEEIRCALRLVHEWDLLARPACAADANS